MYSRDSSSQMVLSTRKNKYAFLSNLDATADGGGGGGGGVDDDDDDDDDDGDDDDDDANSTCNTLFIGSVKYVLFKVSTQISRTSCSSSWVVGSRYRLNHVTILSSVQICIHLYIEVEETPFVIINIYIY